MKQLVSDETVLDESQTSSPVHAKPKVTSKVQSIEEFLCLPQPHTPGQELQHFGDWVGDPIWVPPKDNSEELAKSMLNRFGASATEEECWKGITREHRSKFTQVRRFELPRASIRLPKGQLYVTVTEQKNFHTIEEEIPKSVQMRLDEFLEENEHKHGVKVYYLKPLCVEVDNELIFTTEEELNEAISKIQSEVFAMYRRMYPWHLARKISIGLFDATMALPRTMLELLLNRKKKEIDMVHAKAEFERRKRAMKALKYRKNYRMDRCSFDEVLSLTTTPDRKDVIDFYVEENSLSELDRKLFLMASAVALPWFAALSLAAYQMALVTVTSTASVAMVDPVFVAEMPREKGKLLKIGHFDEVDGVMHVEI